MTRPPEELPLLISVPHAGLVVPPEVEEYCILTPADIEQDGDEDAADIYGLAFEVRSYVTTDVARAIIDLNRAANDLRMDGIVKTHTCHGVPVYDPFPPESVIERLIERYYRPYHRRLTELAGAGVKLGLDCHTMLAIGPAIGPGPGKERPSVCLSNGDGTCPDSWFRILHACFESAFEPFRVTTNDPFTGGYITRSHAVEMPWVQVEISRAPFLSLVAKRKRLLQALARWTTETR